MDNARLMCDMDGASQHGNQLGGGRGRHAAFGSEALGETASGAVLQGEEG